MRRGRYRTSLLSHELRTSPSVASESADVIEAIFAIKTFVIEEIDTVRVISDVDMYLIIARHEQDVATRILRDGVITGVVMKILRGGFADHYQTWIHEI